MNDKLKKELFYIFSFLIFTIFVGWDIQRGAVQAYSPALEDYNTDSGEVSVAKFASQEPMNVSEPTPTPLEFGSEVERYIYEVFDDDYDKAILLLKGIKDINGNYICGGENRSLDQNAININKDGSKDFGIFQINDFYHPVYELDLHKDYKANIDYAKRMFDNDGKTFSKRWVAGSCINDYGYEI